jgi:hypothetical protein
MRIRFVPWALYVVAAGCSSNPQTQPTTADQAAEGLTVQSFDHAEVFGLFVTMAGSDKQGQTFGLTGD